MGEIYVLKFESPDRPWCETRDGCSSVDWLGSTVDSVSGHPELAILGGLHSMQPFARQRILLGNRIGREFSMAAVTSGHLESCQIMASEFRQIGNHCFLAQSLLAHRNTPGLPGLNHPAAYSSGWCAVEILQSAVCSCIDY